MSTPDDTYNAIMRSPFLVVMAKINKADPYGSYTFNRMNSEGKWRVQKHFEYIVIDEGWTVHDFNNELENYYSK